MTHLVREKTCLTGYKLRHLFQSSAVLLLLLAILTAPAAADNAAIPDLPVQFYGTLYNHHGEPFPAGTVITAEVNGQTSTFTVSEDGKIGGSGTFDDKFLISGVEDGDTIIFQIEGTTETVTTVYHESAGTMMSELQLEIPIEIPEVPATQTPSTPSPQETETSSSSSSSSTTSSSSTSSSPSGGQTTAPTTEPAGTETVPASTETVPTSVETVPTSAAPTEAQSPAPVAGVLFGLFAAGVVLKISRHNSGDRK